MAMRILVFLGLSALFFPNLSYSQEPEFQLNGKNFSQGDVVILRRIDKAGGEFDATFLGRERKSFRFGGHQAVLLGIDFRLKPGAHRIVVSPGLAGGTSHSFLINVREIYPKLKYEPPKRPADQQKRINEEQRKKTSALKEMSLEVRLMDHFIRPISPVKINAPFGDVRCRDRRGWKKFNCRYHLGTDYRSAFDFFHQKPEQAVAINPGRVVRTAENLIDGKIVILDHGNGISSEYLHLSKFLVKEGDMVARGQKIGITGKTGSTNAIHLHLTIKMDNGKTVVDPEVFLKTLSK